jgi:Na+/H+ antiporter NhaA
MTRRSRPRLQRLTGPLRDFREIESSGAIVLLAATVVALVWANSPWRAGYEDLATDDVRHWVNDGLMALFFLVVGLEIKR